MDIKSLSILELFENLLDDKDIEIPCSDLREQNERHLDGNTAKLYGMEYWALIDKIEEILNSQ